MRALRNEWAKMRPLAEWQPGRIRGLLFDIDDTLTTHGKLTAAAYAAMERLKAAGRIVVPITGRPAGWCDQIARFWPVDAVVGENGAFYFWHDARAGKLQRRYHDPDHERAQKRAQLHAIAARILREVPGCAVASDQPYRETDLAIDFCEDVPPLPLSAAEQIAALMRDTGIVRNRMKIEGAVHSARAYLKVMESGPGLAKLLWDFLDGRPKVNQFRSTRQVPAETELSRAMSKELANRGFKFCGPTIVYAFMQATGMVNDHLVTCHRHAACAAVRISRR